MLVRKLRFAAALMALACSTVVLAQATPDQLQAQVDALQKKVEALEAKQVSVADVNATVERVMADAQRRSELMQPDGFTAGYNKGKFTMQSADGAYSFSPTAQFQFRYEGTYREDAKHGAPGIGDSDSYDDGFELRRMKFGMAGNAVTTDLSYKFQWATDRATGGVALEDAWLRYKISDNWAIFGGQFEDLTSHEALVSSARQLAVEQSYANRVLLDNFSEYTQGFGGTYSTKALRLSGALTDGANSDNTNYQDQPLAIAPTPASATALPTVYWGASARAELMVLGDNWKQYDDFSALNNKSDMLILGSGVSYSDADGGGLWLYSVDAQWEPEAVSGLALYAAVIGNQFDLNGASSYNNTGWVVQAGYMLNAKWEVFARYDEVNWDSTDFAEGADNNVQECTVGVNYFISGHAAKFTADVVYLPNGTPRGESGLGIMPEGDSKQEAVARLQFQLLL